MKAIHFGRLKFLMNINEEKKSFPVDSLRQRARV